MTIAPLHRWDLSPKDARELQSRLATELVTDIPLPDWSTLAAADVSFERFGTELFAAVVVVERGTNRVLEKVGVSVPATFPYVPGLLSFREAPGLIAAFEKLGTLPDVVLCDGQGIAHPRRLGIASHLGLWLGRPTIGCAKSRLWGDYVEPGPLRGDRSDLLDHGAVIGQVVRTKDRVKPLFVSPGHQCDLASSVAVVLELSGKYRLPQPARMAHEFVNEIRRSA